MQHPGTLSGRENLFALLFARMSCDWICNAVFELNDAGVQLFTARNYDLALETFEDAIKALKVAVRGQELDSGDACSLSTAVSNAQEQLPSERTSQHEGTTSDTRMAFVTSETDDDNLVSSISSFPEDNSLSPRQQILGSSDNLNPFIYSNPIRLKSLKQSCDGFRRKFILAYVAPLVLFNLALCHHVVYDIRGSRKSSMMALGLYEKTFLSLSIVWANERTTTRVIMSHDEFPPCVKHAINHVSQASLNNIAQIYYMEGRYDIAMEMYRRLSESNPHGDLALNIAVLSNHTNSPAA